MNWLVPLMVLVPLLGAAITLTAARKQRLQIALASVTMVISLTISIVLLTVVHQTGTALVVQVGGWAAPFGISLVVDRLSACSSSSRASS